MSRKNPSTHHPYIEPYRVDEFSVTRPSIDLTGIDLQKFGIVAIRVVRGTDVIRRWDA